MPPWTCRPVEAMAAKAAARLIGALGVATAWRPDIEGGDVHHRKHALYPAICFANKPADGAAIVAEGEDAGRAGMDAELVLEADGADVVTVAQAAIRIDEEFRHQEKRDAPGAGRCIGQARQHHVHDVLGEIVVAIGDEDLLSGDAVMIPFLDPALAQPTHILPRLPP